MGNSYSTTNAVDDFYTEQPGFYTLEWLTIDDSCESEFVLDPEQVSFYLDAKYDNGNVPRTRSRNNQDEWEMMPSTVTIQNAGMNINIPQRTPVPVFMADSTTTKFVFTPETKPSAILVGRIAKDVLDRMEPIHSAELNIGSQLIFADGRIGIRANDNRCISYVDTTKAPELTFNYKLLQPCLLIKE